MMLCIAVNLFISLLYSILVHEYLSILLLMDIWVVSMLGLLQIVLLGALF